MATTTSEPVYVWVWLPGSIEPVPAGVLERRGVSSELSFRYGDRYVARPGAVSIYGPQLPLEPGVWFGPTANLGMPGCLRDASPDSWGRRVIINRRSGGTADDTDTTALSEETYLLESDSNRWGAVDFQLSATDYVAREEGATLDQLQRAAEYVSGGEPLPDALRRALIGGTAIGGARPKALLHEGSSQYIAKFSTSDDPMDVVGAEAASVALARAVGIPVTNSKVVRSLGKKVLLLERFDRDLEGHRRMVVSGLTMLGLPETYVPLGSYPDILDVLRKDGASGAGLGRSLFQRIAFNMAISNSDDHLRNHAAFWSGQHLDLTPAYDLTPGVRSGETANQALAYARDGRRASNLASLIDVCAIYDLTTPDARALVDDMLGAMRDHWIDAADSAELTTVDRKSMWGRQFLNPGAIAGL